MPRYDYDCAACGRRFEVVHGIHADGPATCPLCGRGPVRKAISAAAVHFKGSGWAKKERRPAHASAASKEGSETTATGAGGSKETSSTSDGGAKETTSTTEGGAPKSATPAPSKSAEAGATSKTD
jgi:putative FmdB family regulatory protein